MAENSISILVPEDNGIQLTQYLHGEPAVTSLQLAEHFSTRHRHVLRDIRAIIRKVPEIFAQSNFGPSEYIDATGRKLPCYLLTRDAFTLLAMGYNSPRAIAWKLKYIEAFNALEQMALEHLCGQIEVARQEGLEAGRREVFSIRRRDSPAYRALMRRALRYRGMGLELRDIGKLMDCSHQKIFFMLKDAKILGLEA